MSPIRPKEYAKKTECVTDSSDPFSVMEENEEPSSSRDERCHQPPEFCLQLEDCTRLMILKDHIECLKKTADIICKADRDGESIEHEYLFGAFLESVVSQMNVEEIVGIIQGFICPLLTSKFGVDIADRVHDLLTNAIFRLFGVPGVRSSQGGRTLTVDPGLCSEGPGLPKNIKGLKIDKTQIEQFVAAVIQAREAIAHWEDIPSTSSQTVIPNLSAEDLYATIMNELYSCQEELTCIARRSGYSSDAPQKLLESIFTAVNTLQAHRQDIIDPRAARARLTATKPPDSQSSKEMPDVLAARMETLFLESSESQQKQGEPSQQRRKWKASKNQRRRRNR